MDLVERTYKWDFRKEATFEFAGKQWNDMMSTKLGQMRNQARESFEWHSKNEAWIGAYKDFDGCSKKCDLTLRPILWDFGGISTKVYSS